MRVIRQGLFTIDNLTDEAAQVTLTPALSPVSEYGGGSEGAYRGRYSYFSPSPQPSPLGRGGLLGGVHAWLYTFTYPSQP